MTSPDLGGTHSPAEEMKGREQKSLNLGSTYSLWKRTLKEVMTEPK
jgi:hypothetical protein